ncbi:MAG: hypothetical protein AMJ81_13565 [Phycisphaerae bacterium SM23_33]|nr:MAG: hypothetical protein AMJ81_13565 [Phycisphaerae bacterium SM23_33]
MPTPKRPAKKAGATRTAKQQAAAATSAPADPTPTTATPTAQDPASGRPNSGRARTKSASAAPKPASAAPKPASAAAKPTPAAAGSASPGSAPAPAERQRPRSRRPRVAALLLNAFLVLLGAGLLLGLLYWFEGLPAREEAVSTVAKAPAAQTPQREVPPPPAAPAPPPESLSWQLAERAYRSKDYELARERYGLLLARSAATPANAAVSDFFRFRIGRCLARSGKLEEARALLGSVSHSDSPIVQAAADYDLAVLDYLAGNHLAARAKAYSAVAALAAMEAGFPLETDCDYLAARALTDKALAFHETSLSVPLSHRWQEADVFGGLEQEALRRLLNEGRGGAEQAVLGPQVSKARGPAGASRYSVVCCQGPLEELLQRLSLEAGMEIRWESVAPAARRRTVTMVFKVGSAQRICEVACGGVGLLARFTGEQAIIHDPHACPSLSEQRELLYAEAVSTWRRFLLRSPGDPRLGEGHFAVAALHECFADTSSALREYHGRRGFGFGCATMPGRGRTWWSC